MQGVPLFLFFLFIFVGFCFSIGRMILFIYFFFLYPLYGFYIETKKSRFFLFFSFSIFWRKASGNEIRKQEEKMMVPPSRTNTYHEEDVRGAIHRLLTTITGGTDMILLEYILTLLRYNKPFEVCVGEGGKGKVKEV